MFKADNAEAEVVGKWSSCSVPDGEATASLRQDHLTSFQLFLSMVTASVTLYNHSSVTYPGVVLFIRLSIYTRLTPFPPHAI